MTPNCGADYSRYLDKERSDPFSEKLKKASFWCQVLINFYGGAIESILTGDMTKWCGSRRARIVIYYNIYSFL